MAFGPHLHINMSTLQRAATFVLSQMFVNNGLAIANVLPAAVVSNV